VLRLTRRDDILRSTYIDVVSKVWIGFAYGRDDGRIVDDGIAALDGGTNLLRAPEITPNDFDLRAKLPGCLLVALCR
jgi:hypothetical protein